MNININGQNINPEEFIRMQEEQERQKLEFYNNLKKEFDCNCALIVPANQGYAIVCSIDKVGIPNREFCLNCKAYNNTDYTNL